MSGFSPRGNASEGFQTPGAGAVGEQGGPGPSVTGAAQAATSQGGVEGPAEDGGQSGGCEGTGINLSTAEVILAQVEH